jgi:hypothetical protein
MAAKGLAHPAYQAQRGTVLLISMVFLLLLAWLGMGAAQMAKQATTMSTSAQDMQRAFEAAENALQDIEAQLPAWQADFDGPGLLDHSHATAAQQRLYASSAQYWIRPQAEAGYGWFDETGRMDSGLSITAVLRDEVSSPPQYVLEYLGQLTEDSLCGKPPQHHYRATVWANGQLVTERPLSAPHVLLQAEWCLCTEVACGAENSATEQHPITERIFWQQLH